MTIRAWWRQGAFALSALLCQSFTPMTDVQLLAGDTFRLPPVEATRGDGDFFLRSQSEGLVTDAAPCDVCAAPCDACGIGNWWDNTELFLGADAFASVGDSPAGGFGNNFGVVTGFNSGFALGESKIRGQFGASYGAYDPKGRSLFGLENSALEEQVFLTGGIYKRSDIENSDRISWGVVYDGLITDNYGILADELALGQFRGIFGYALNECHEVGGWGTLHVNDDSSSPLATLRAMNQANAYWKQNWQYGASTSVYVGAMDSADVGDWVLGVTGRAPLSERVALYSGATYVTPSSATGAVGSVEAQWNVFTGLVYTPGGKSVSRTVSGQAGLPLLPVANNSTFLITD
ncbi:MAG TPA: DUF6666 family protein [Pirellulaceae bacterium]|nr:DUF6666 family protein [Pirellulaceae bacterium]